MADTSTRTMGRKMTIGNGGTSALMAGVAGFGLGMMVSAGRKAASQAATFAAGDWFEGLKAEHQAALEARVRADGLLSQARSLLDGIDVELRELEQTRQMGDFRLQRRRPVEQSLLYNVTSWPAARREPQASPRLGVALQRRLRRATRGTGFVVAVPVELGVGPQQRRNGQGGDRHGGPPGEWPCKLTPKRHLAGAT